MSFYIIRVKTKGTAPKGKTASTFEGFYNYHNGPYYSNVEANLFTRLDEVNELLDLFLVGNREDGTPGSELIERLPGLSERTSPMTVNLTVFEVGIAEPLIIRDIVVGYTVAQVAAEKAKLIASAKAKLTTEERKALGIK